MQYIEKIPKLQTRVQGTSLHTTVETHSWPRQCPFRQSHNRIDRPLLVLPTLLRSPPLPAQNFHSLSMLWARAEVWQLAVFRGACALRSLLLCVRLEQWGSTIAYRLLCTSAGRGICTFHGHLYQYLHRSASHFILLSWYSTRSYVQPDYCFAAPPALASPSVICVCLASGHQLELDFNTATDRHTLLQLPAGLENRRWEIRCNVCRSSAHYIPALFAFFPSLVSHIITFASFKHAFHLPKEGNRKCNLKFNITDQFTHIRLHVYPKSKTRYPSTLLKRFQIRSLYTYNNLKHIRTPL